MKRQHKQTFMTFFCTESTTAHSTEKLTIHFIAITANNFKYNEFTKF